MNRSSTKSYRMQISLTLGALLLLTVLLPEVASQCGGSCSSCARRYGCLTPDWGRCCTQFFMHNGKKRSPVDNTEVFTRYVADMMKRREEQRRLQSVSDQWSALDEGAHI